MEFSRIRYLSDANVYLCPYLDICTTHVAESTELHYHEAGLAQPHHLHLRVNKCSMPGFRRFHRLCNGLASFENAGDLFRRLKDVLGSKQLGARPSVAELVSDCRSWEVQ